MVGLSCPSATGWASSSDGVLGSVSVKTVLYGSALQYKSGGVVSLFFYFSTPDDRSIVEVPIELQKHDILKVSQNKIWVLIL